MNKKRYQFTCWQCEKSFGRTLALGETKPKLSSECPYCGAECVVDLAYYRNPIEGVFKSVDKPGTIDLTTLDLPDVIPTDKPEDDSSDSSDSAG